MRVSVIVTTFNSEKTIEATLTSILHQSAVTAPTPGQPPVELEILVADDGSTDRTLEILNRFPVRILPCERNTGGPNAGRNRGLRHATGTAIAIADHDDLWAPDRLARQLPHLANAPIVSCGYILDDQSMGRRIERYHRANEESTLYEENRTFLDRLQRSHKGQNVYIGGLLYHASLRHVEFEERFGMLDLDWLLRLFEHQRSIEVNAPLFTRRVDGRNLSLNPTYRANDFYGSSLAIDSYYPRYPREARRGLNSYDGSRARYFYLMGNLERARYYFRKGGGWKNALFLLSTYLCPGYIRRRFHFFG